MAHFAQLDDYNNVVTVNVVNNSDCGGGDFPDSEPIGQAYLASLGLSGVWKQTSYHANFRGVFAQIGYIYDAVADKFVSPVSEVVE